MFTSNLPVSNPQAVSLLSSFSSVITDTTDSDSMSLAESTDPLVDDSSSLEGTQQPPSEDDIYNTEVFDINWSKLEYVDGSPVAQTGTVVGFRIIHRRSHGGHGKTALIWKYNADISLQ